MYGAAYGSKGIYLLLREAVQGTFLINCAYFTYFDMLHILQITHIMHVLHISDIVRRRHMLHILQIIHIMHILAYYYLQICMKYA